MNASTSYVRLNNLRPLITAVIRSGFIRSSNSSRVRYPFNAASSRLLFSTWAVCAWCAALSYQLRGSAVTNMSEVRPYQSISRDRPQPLIMYST
jgi:hypothetical protein